LVGIGGADVGTTPMPTDTHVHGKIATCITCHMNERDHSFEPSLDACNTAACHNGSITSLHENARQLAVEAKYEELENALIALGLLEVDSETGEVGQVTGVYDVDHVGALYNWDWVHADGSDGIHNFIFIEALLDKGLEALE